MRDQRGPNLVICHEGIITRYLTKHHDTYTANEFTVLVWFYYSKGPFNRTVQFGMFIGARRQKGEAQQRKYGQYSGSIGDMAVNREEHTRSKRVTAFKVVWEKRSEF